MFFFQKKRLNQREHAILVKMIFLSKKFKKALSTTRQINFENSNDLEFL